MFFLNVLLAKAERAITIDSQLSSCKQPGLFLSLISLKDYFLLHINKINKIISYFSEVLHYCDMV